MDESETDVEVLLECLKRQNRDHQAMKRSLLALASVFSNNGNTKQYFRRVKGLQLVYGLLKADLPDYVVQAAVLCLACAVENDVFGQNELIRNETFEFLHSVLAQQKDTKWLQAGIFLANNLVARNCAGQQLSKESGILSDLITIVRLCLERHQQNEGQHTEDVDLCLGAVTALGMCVNNPQNEVNQRLCCPILPLCFQVVLDDRWPHINSSLLTFAGLTVAGNSFNQKRMKSCGGMGVLCQLLKRCDSQMTATQRLPPILQGVVSAINACISDHKENACQFIEEGGVNIMMQWLSGSCHLSTYHLLEMMLTLGHALEFADKAMVLLTPQHQTMLVRLLTDAEDEELASAVKFVLTTWQHQGEREEFHRKALNTVQRIERVVQQLHSADQDETDDQKNMRMVQSIDDRMERSCGDRMIRSSGDRMVRSSDNRKEQSSDDRMVRSRCDRMERSSVDRMVHSSDDRMERSNVQMVQSSVDRTVQSRGHGMDQHEVGRVQFNEPRFLPDNGIGQTNNTYFGDNGHYQCDKQTRDQHQHAVCQCKKPRLARSDFEMDHHNGSRVKHDGNDLNALCRRGVEEDGNMNRGRAQSPQYRLAAPPVPSPILLQPSAIPCTQGPQSHGDVSNSNYDADREQATVSVLAQRGTTQLRCGNRNFGRGSAADSSVLPPQPDSASYKQGLSDPPAVSRQQNMGQVQTQRQVPNSYPQAQVPTSYPQTRVPTSYAQTQVPTSYAQTQVPMSYPQTQVPMSYPQTQVPTSYSQTQVPTSYAQTQVPTSYAQTQVPTSYAQTQVPTSYAQTQVPTSYAQTQVPTSYAQTQVPTSYSQTQVPTSYSQTQVPTSYPQPQVPKSDPQTHGLTSYPQMQVSVSYPQAQEPTLYPQALVPTSYSQMQVPTSYPKTQVSTQLYPQLQSSANRGQSSVGELGHPVIGSDRNSAVSPSSHLPASQLSSLLQPPEVTQAVFCPTQLSASGMGQGGVSSSSLQATSSSAFPSCLTSEASTSLPTVPALTSCGLAGPGLFSQGVADPGLFCQGEVGLGLSSQEVRVPGWSFHEVAALSGLSSQGVAGPGLSSQGVAGPGLSSQEVAGPGLSFQGMAGPGLSSQGMAGPGLSLQGMTDPGLSSQGVAGPGLSSEGVVGPGLSSQEVAGPGLSFQGMAGPGFSSQGMAGPGLSLQGMAGPGLSSQEVAGHVLSSQEVAGPGLSSQRVNGHGLSSYGVAVPAMSSHGDAGPGLSSSRVSGPGISSRRVAGPGPQSVSYEVQGGTFMTAPGIPPVSLDNASPPPPIPQSSYENNGLPIVSAQSGSRFPEYLQSTTLPVSLSSSSLALPPQLSAGVQGRGLFSQSSVLAPISLASLGVQPSQYWDPLMQMYGVPPSVSHQQQLSSVTGDWGVWGYSPGAGNSDRFVESGENRAVLHSAANSSHPTQNIAMTVNSTQGVARTGQSTQDISRTSNPTEDLAMTAQSTQNIVRTGNPTQVIAKTSHSTHDITKTSYLTQDSAGTSFAAQDITRRNHIQNITRTNHTENITRTNRTEDDGRTNHREDVARTSRTEDVARTSRTEDVARTNRTDDVARKSCAEDVSRTSRTEDLARTDRVEDVSRTNQAEDVGTNHKENIIRTNRIEDVARINRTIVTRTNHTEDVARKNTTNIIRKSNCRMGIARGLQQRSNLQTNVQKSPMLITDLIEMETPIHQRHSSQIAAHREMPALDHDDKHISSADEAFWVKEDAPWNGESKADVRTPRGKLSSAQSAMDTAAALSSRARVEVFRTPLPKQAPAGFRGAGGDRTCVKRVEDSGGAVKNCMLVSTPRLRRTPSRTLTSQCKRPGTGVITPAHGTMTESSGLPLPAGSISGKKLDLSGVQYQYGSSVTVRDSPPRTAVSSPALSEFDCQLIKVATNPVCQQGRCAREHTSAMRDPIGQRNCDTQKVTTKRCFPGSQRNVQTQKISTENILNSRENAETLKVSTKQPFPKSHRNCETGIVTPEMAGRPGSSGHFLEDVESLLISSSEGSDTEGESQVLPSLPGNGSLAETHKSLSDLSSCVSEEYTITNESLMPLYAYDEPSIEICTVCPGCSTESQLNSRTFNIAVEISGSTCLAHRSVRQLERDYIQRRGIKQLSNFQYHGQSKFKLGKLRWLYPPCSGLPLSMCEERRLRRALLSLGHNWTAILRTGQFIGRSAQELREQWRKLCQRKKERKNVTLDS